VKNSNSYEWSIDRTFITFSSAYQVHSSEGWKDRTANTAVVSKGLGLAQFLSHPELHFLLFLVHFHWVANIFDFCLVYLYPW